MAIERMKTSTLMRAGLVGLLLWNVLQYFVGRSGSATDTTDFALGALFGLSVTLLLVSVSRRARHRA